MLAEAAPGGPAAERQPEVPGVILPTEALRDAAPVLEGLKVTALPTGGSSVERAGGTSLPPAGLQPGYLG